MNNFEMQDACKAEINRCFEVAKENFPNTHFENVTIYFESSTSLKTTAGVANYKEYSINLNMSLIARNFETFIADTPAHEAAHLISFTVFGRKAAGHTPEWKTIYALLTNKTAKRCHTMRTSGEIIYNQF